MGSEYILPKSHPSVFADSVVAQQESLNLTYVIRQENLWFECLDPLNVPEYVVEFAIPIVLKSLLSQSMANLLVRI